jgi:hypothetical protein
MSFKGTINKNGRTPGTPNKVTSEVRESFNHLLKNNVDKIQDDINQLKPYERVKVILELAKFVLPTLKAMDIDASDMNFKEIVFEFGSHES